nr:uncharacterized protein CTRU02_02763 [Colletotrichum truncatum]KAF6797721.1 hypothetical protein CTRU02_02763 [Colletotrichum truncatum]
MSTAAGGVLEEWGREDGSRQSERGTFREGALLVLPPPSSNYYVTLKRKRVRPSSGKDPVSMPVTLHSTGLTLKASPVSV